MIKNLLILVGLVCSLIWSFDADGQTSFTQSQKDSLPIYKDTHISAIPDEGVRAAAKRDVDLVTVNQKKQVDVAEKLAVNEAEAKGTVITAMTFSLNSKNRTFLYKGDVKVVQPDMTLTSDELIGSYGDDNKIVKMEAIGDVVILKEGMEASGNRAIYTASGRVLDLMESPVVVQDGSALKADKIKVFLDTGLSQATGNVRVDVVDKANSVAASN